MPKLSRRSHGVFVSEMPYEMEEEKERDEEDSGDDLDDVEKFLNEDDESDMVFGRGPTETTRNLKRETAEVLDDRQNLLQTVQHGSSAPKLRS